MERILYAKKVKRVRVAVHNMCVVLIFIMILCICAIWPDSDEQLEEFRYDVQQHINSVAIPLLISAFVLFVIGCAWLDFTRSKNKKLKR